MENKLDLIETIDAIVALSASIDPLLRAEKVDAIAIVVEKLLELVAKLK